MNKEFVEVTDLSLKKMKELTFDEKFPLCRAGIIDKMAGKFEGSCRYLGCRSVLKLREPDRKPSFWLRVYPGRLAEVFEIVDNSLLSTFFKDRICFKVSFSWAGRDIPSWGQMHWRFFDWQNLQTGLVSSHFLCLLLHVKHPVLTLLLSGGVSFFGFLEKDFDLRLLSLESESDVELTE